MALLQCYRLVLTQYFVRKVIRCKVFLLKIIYRKKKTLNLTVQFSLWYSVYETFFPKIRRKQFSIKIIRNLSLVSLRNASINQILADSRTSSCFPRKVMLLIHRHQSVICCFDHFTLFDQSFRQSVGAFSKHLASSFIISNHFTSSPDESRHKADERNCSENVSPAKGKIINKWKITFESLN